MSAQDRLELWICNDYPVYYAATETMNTNRKAGFGIHGAAEAVRDIVLDIFYVRPVNGYRELCREVPSTLHPNGYPVEPGAMVWTRESISEHEFQEIDWEQVVKALDSDIEWS